MVKIKQCYTRKDGIIQTTETHFIDACLRCVKVKVVTAFILLVKM